MPLNYIPSLARGCGLESKEGREDYLKNGHHSDSFKDTAWRWTMISTFLRVITFIPLFFSREKKYIPPEHRGVAGGHVCGNVGAGFPNPRNTLLIALHESRRTELVHRSPPVHLLFLPPSFPSLFLIPALSLSLSFRPSLCPSLFLRFSVLHSLPSLAVLLSVSSLPLSLFSPSTFTGSIRNGEHAAVQRLREPHATTPAPNHHPSFPRLCHAWCQPVWPPTHTTFSSFPPLTSLPSLPPFPLSLSFFSSLSTSSFPSHATT